MEYAESFGSFITGNWPSLLVVLGVQVVIVIAAWKLLDEDKGKLVAAFLLALSPMLILLQRGHSDQQKRLEAIERNSGSSRVESLVSHIASRNPDGLPSAQRVLIEAIGELEKISGGVETIGSEIDYFSALTQELDRTKNGERIIDVVMPLNPSRVGKPGRAPLVAYLNAVKEAIRTRGIRYQLIVMPSEGRQEDIDAALARFVEVGVDLWVINREQLPADLRDNFSLYPSNNVYCVAERGDDAVILRGERVRNNDADLAARDQKVKKILNYANKYELVQASEE